MKLGVQSEDLHSEATSVRSGASEVNHILQKLTAEISNLAASWEGGASAFRDRWHEWQTGAEQIRQAMDDMGAFLEQAAHSYEATEEHIKSAAGR
jgi:WXG100 family type VII secretion target